MAVFLTYFAVATTYVPAVITGLYERPDEAENSTGSAPSQDDEFAGTTASMPAGLVIVPVTRPAEAQSRATSRTATSSPATAPSEAGLDEEGGEKAEVVPDEENPFIRMGPVGIVIACVLAVLIALVVAMAVPLIAVFSGEILWAIIIGIGVYTAWKINKREKVIVEGPFELAPVGEYADEDEIARE